MSQHLTKYTELLRFPNILYRFNGVVVSASDIAAAVAVRGTDALAIVCAVDLCCSPLIRIPYGPYAFTSYLNCCFRHQSETFFLLLTFQHQKSY